MSIVRQVKRALPQTSRSLRTSRTAFSTSIAPSATAICRRRRSIEDADAARQVEWHPPSGPSRHDEPRGRARARRPRRLASARPVFTVLLSVVFAWWRSPTRSATSGRHLGAATSPPGKVRPARRGDLGRFPAPRSARRRGRERRRRTIEAYAHRSRGELRREAGDVPARAYRIDPKRSAVASSSNLAPPDLADIRDEIDDHQAFLTSFAAPADARPPARWPSGRRS